METEERPGRGPYREVDLPSLASAIIAGFIALGNEAWWILQGANTDQLLDVKVSPFYVQINALGAPSTIPAALIIGGFTRILLLSTTLLLLFSAFRLQAWWRQLAVWFSLSSLAELYLSFLLLLHFAQVTLLSSYGSTPPVMGTGTLQGSILGLDLALYPNPTITATLAPPFFFGLTSFAILATTQLYAAMHNRQPQLIASELTKGLREVYLSPPYEHAWLSSSDEDYNPLARDPEKVRDDQLALSLNKLSKTVQPGGIVSIILPAGAIRLAQRLSRLMPLAGLRAEKMDVVYRVPGRPESELVFRKVVEKKEEPTVELVVEGLPPPSEITPENPPEPASPEEDLAWDVDQMSRQELALLRSAAEVIERRREPVPYRELLNDVYMDLLNRQVDFGSARQIETILLKHVGRELNIIEEVDETGYQSIKKWWLGDKGLEQDANPSSSLWKRISSRARPGIPRILRAPSKWKQKLSEPRYKPRKRAAED